MLSIIKNGNYMHVFKWLEKTSPSKKGLNRAQKAELVKLRKDACDRAGTRINILINNKCRGAIGRDLVERMSRATANDKIKILVEDHFSTDK